MSNRINSINTRQLEILIEGISEIRKMKEDTFLEDKEEELQSAYRRLFFDLALENYFITDYDFSTGNGLLTGMLREAQQGIINSLPDSTLILLKTNKK